MDLADLQWEQAGWADKNFPDQDPYLALLGVVEEVGELCHNHLKSVQNIRGYKDHEAAGKDAVGDIMVFLAHYCTGRGWDLNLIVSETWAAVKRRDWKKDPERGGEDG